MDLSVLWYLWDSSLHHLLWNLLNGCSTWRVMTQYCLLFLSVAGWANLAASHCRPSRDSLHSRCFAGNHLTRAYALIVRRVIINKVVRLLQQPIVVLVLMILHSSMWRLTSFPICGLGIVIIYSLCPTDYHFISGPTCFLWAFSRIQHLRSACVTILLLQTHFSLLIGIGCSLFFTTTV
jgi:hypothetical protein